MGVQWTAEQKQVIDLRDRNILVSAAAGSGKTAVLVERIITRLTKDANPVDVDRLLIVTYTDAAAGEMRERIGDAIERALEKDPGNTHLKKQEALIHTAKITTIHSFCLSVIKEYFHTIDLDPGFRIAEEGELKLLKQDVMRELLESKYEEGSGDFLRFVETFATGREDAKLEEIISQLYEFAGSYPDPEEWIDRCADAYRMPMDENAPYIQMAMRYIKSCLADVETMMEAAETICMEPDGPYMYGAMIEEDREKMEPLFHADSYEEMYWAILPVTAWASLSSKKDDTVDAQKRARAKAYRDSWKKLVGDIRDAFFFQSPEEMRSDMEMCCPVMLELLSLVKEFQNALAEKKAEKNLIDFRDMEQFALKILTRKVDGKLVPSEVAKEYQDLFEEVMIDEYQDSNLIQEAILTSVSRMERGENNLFMVGDVKQSIYRFRLSRPELFMEKFDSYSTTDGDCRRIDLHKNFRSRREVLDTVNAIFRQIMTRKLGGIEYDDQAALYVGADYREMCGNETEILVVDTGADEEEDGQKSKKIGQETVRELEARAVAERIHGLMESQKIWDKEIGDFRSVRYSDIVILTRSLAGWADVFAKVLNREGIPAFAGSKEGYFGTLEIGWMLDYLRVLDNFRQDLPMAAVMKSPFGGFTNEELAVIREAWPELPFCEAVLRAAGVSRTGMTDGRKAAESEEETDYDGVSAEIRGKLDAVFGTLQKFRKKVPYTAIHDLLREIMKETGYRNFIAAMPGGEQRLANLEMLLARAKAFEATSYKGLYHFIRYIEQLEKYDVDYGEAGIFDEQTNAVRIMSIHKSKGLEFPVVIVAGMGKRFNTQDIKNSVVIHPELGLGMDAVDIERRTKCPTLLKKVIQTETGLENLGEELRVLYVAMTRAKEKLILTGTVSGAARKLEAYGAQASEYDDRTTMAFTALTGAKCFFDWVLPAAVRLAPEEPVGLKIINISELVWEEAGREAADVLDKEVFLKLIEEENGRMSETDDAFAGRLAEQFSYRYPYKGEAQLKLKYTVSELKKHAALPGEEQDAGAFLVEEEDVIPLIPKFLQEEEELTGASRGSAYHKFLELLDFGRAYDEESLREAVEGMKREGLLGAEMAECIRISDMLQFLTTDAGRRMHAAALAGKLHKEQPFVFGIDAEEIYPGTDSKELVLIQGIIDVYFEEEDGLVVLDYKTDKVCEGRELVEKYQEQLHLYAKALEQMTLKKVKDQIIYSFTLAEEIILDRQQEEQ